MSKAIKFIYFDVGGTLLIDFNKTNKWQQMKQDLGVTDKNDKNFEAIWKEYRHKICINQDVDDLIPILNSKVGLKIPKNYSMLEDFINRFDLNPSVWPVAEYAKEKFKVGLLTNQYPRMLKIIRKRKLIPDINWDIVIDSSVVGLQKNDLNYFKFSQEKAKTEPKHILYIDDKPEFLKKAAKLGWKTFLYDPASPIQSSKELLKLLKNSS